MAPLFNQRKLNILLAVVFALAVAGIIDRLYENHLDDTQIIVTGKLVRVKYGFYQDCKGVVLNDVYSETVKDREGVTHIGVFAGYAVDLTCNNEHTGSRFFTPDFLRVVRK